VAERSVQTVVSWAITMLLRAVIHWPEVADLQLWPFALHHAVYLWNVLQNSVTKLSPLEYISQSHVQDYAHLQCLHVWVCPKFVLNPCSQDGNKLPNWSPHLRLGSFMGYSQVHYSIVRLVLYIQTGAVTPQYHLVHDDWFSTVSNMKSASLPPALWQQLLSTGYEHNEYDKDAIADSWSGSEPFAVREVDLGSTNTSDMIVGMKQLGMKKVSKALREDQFMMGINS